MKLPLLCFIVHKRNALKKAECSGGYKRFGGTYNFHLQGRRLLKKFKCVALIVITEYGLGAEVLTGYNTSTLTIISYATPPTKQCHNPEDHKVSSHSRELLKPPLLFVSCVTADICKQIQTRVHGTLLENSYVTSRLKYFFAKT
jgi:hypothetical protein